jgi:hypothetical protein
VRAMSAALRDFDAMVMVPMYQSCIVLVGVTCYEYNSSSSPPHLTTRCVRLRASTPRHGATMRT